MFGLRLSFILLFTETNNIGAALRISYGRTVKLCNEFLGCIVESLQYINNYALKVVAV